MHNIFLPLIFLPSFNVQGDQIGKNMTGKNM